MFREQLVPKDHMLRKLSKSGKKLYKKRKETIERSFADAKQLHGFRYCRWLGRSNK